MLNPELVILTLNSVIIVICYYWLTPKYSRKKQLHMAINDLIGSVLALTIAASLFYHQDYQFTLVFVSVNWFWFTLISYCLIEIPILLWCYIYSQKPGNKP